MRKTALIVDDDGNNLMLEKDLLEVAGFDVFEAGNASGGIAIAMKERPDVIIMDMRLPDMRGSAAARLLRRDDRTRDIPIVFVTASVLAQGSEEIIGISNTSYISKPINTRTFANEVNRFIEGLPKN
jgi:two-component system, cell cycle response regulator DivK